ncbi:DNA replication and repair protein RecF [Candidatus Gottesmanbacteria bacterium]|nr:DNA replication and repair protein RecF [Candidatus Gottesmanbacteria bacterium]
MFLSQLSLQNFRSYTKANFNFSPDTTLIVGPNTVGKTNILEAIFVLGTGKSFRAERDLEMIKFQNELTRIKSEVQNEVSSETVKLEIMLTTGMVDGQAAPGKKYLVNGVSKRQKDFIGMITSVLFAPTDLELITDSPSLRRKYLDFVLMQVDREYRRALSVYEKGLRQRNKLLERIRDEGLGRGQLAFWDELLIKNGSMITLKREEFINFINYLPSEIGDFQIIYDKSEISEARLTKYAREEVASATTLVGPHRDDWKIIIRHSGDPPAGGDSRIDSGPASTAKRGEQARMTNINNEYTDISLFGSRGEQRMAIVWLKLAELEFVTQKIAQRPVLLLDDIFSELDEKHRHLIMEVIPKQQTIITTTDGGYVEKEFLEKAKVIELK